MTAKAAIAVHAFYPDVFAAMLERIALLPDAHALYVTTVRDHADDLGRTLSRINRPTHLHVVENRGRDVLPFLETLPELKADGVETVIKIHTKKSPRRKDGEKWLDDILSQLLDPKSVAQAEQAFASDRTLGMIGPHGHFLTSSTYFGANAARVLSIGSRLGLGEAEIASHGFFGGTMFMARVAGFEPLLQLGFTRDDFEPEAGQKDGTLAHALERAVALSVTAKGQWIATMADMDTPADPQDRYSFAQGHRASAGPLGRLQDIGRRIERWVRRAIRGERRA
ncbi:hypothetical protein IZ6_18090 [Terrihabitans soli]|uniref:Rhamnan synthesis protein F n=1 Tax=Terrihabitans soli TaxID=708113 RepID=A0A6S6QL17_9HYPH|nr:hypothetical protein IZ6_18090 [Terrihabitans soli]